MKKYILQRIYDSEKPVYLTAIYRGSLSNSSDIGDALEFEDKETALNICKYVNERKDTSYTYKVLSIKTVIEEVKKCKNQ